MYSLVQFSGGVAMYSLVQFSGGVAMYSLVQFSGVDLGVHCTVYSVESTV